MIFEEKHRVGFDEVGKDLLMTNRAIMVAFQNVGSRHSDSINYGVLDIPRTSLTWFVVEWKIKVLKRPRYGDEIVLKTWGRDVVKCFSYRDFELYVNGEVYVRATSRWVLFNTEEKTYSNISQELIDLYGNEDNLSAFNEKRLRRMKPLDEYTHKKEIKVRRSDLDFNGHVNNVKYFDYLVDYADVKDFDNIRISYKKEIKYGEKVFLQYDDGHYCITDEDGAVRTLIEVW